MIEPAKWNRVLDSSVGYPGTRHGPNINQYIHIYIYILIYTYICTWIATYIYYTCSLRLHIPVCPVGRPVESRNWQKLQTVKGVLAGTRVLLCILATNPLAATIKTHTPCVGLNKQKRSSYASDDNELIDNDMLTNCSTLLNGDAKRLEAFELWLWTMMERISSEKSGR